MTQKDAGPYIGVTGFTSSEEVEFALGLLPATLSHRLMVGVLTNDDALDHDSSHSNLIPDRDRLASIFLPEPRALNILHYNVKNRDRLAAYLEKAVSMTGPHLDGVQINLSYPPVEQLQRFKERYPDCLIVFQIRDDMYAAYGQSMQRLIAGELQPYASLVNYFSFDLSAGRGIPLDTALARDALGKLQAAFPSHGLVVAGGLTPDNLDELVAPLASDYPTLSIDAESNLRTERNELDLRRVEGYITSALTIFNGEA